MTHRIHAIIDADTCPVCVEADAKTGTAPVRGCQSRNGCRCTSAPPAPLTPEEVAEARRLLAHLEFHPLNDAAYADLADFVPRLLDEREALLTRIAELEAENQGLPRIREEYT